MSDVRPYGIFVCVCVCVCACTKLCLTLVTL